MVRDKLQCDVSGIFLHFYWALKATLFVEQKRNVFIHNSNKNFPHLFLIAFKAYRIFYQIYICLT